MNLPSFVSMMKGELNGPLCPAELTAATSNMYEVNGVSPVAVKLFTEVSAVAFTP